MKSFNLVLNVLVVLTFALALLGSPSHGQEKTDAATAEPETESSELRAELDELRAENRRLTQRLRQYVEAEQAADRAGDQRDEAEPGEAVKEGDRLPQIETIERMRDKAREVNQEQIQMLGNEIKALKKRAAELQLQAGKLSADHQSIQAITRRLAEAQIENRLRLLEAQATRRALMELKEHSAPTASAESRLAVKRARILLDQRQLEQKAAESGIRRAEEGVSNGTASDEAVDLARWKYERAVKQSDEATLMLEFAESQLKQGDAGVDNRLAEAAFQIALTQELGKGLDAEVARLKSLSDTGLQFKVLMERRAALEEKLREMQQDRESKRQLASLYLSEYVNLKVEQSQLETKFGANHPRVHELRQRILAIKKLLNEFPSLSEK